MSFESDVDLMFEDFGVSVTSGLVTGKGVLDMPDAVLGEITQSTEYLLTVKTSVFGDLKFDDSITVNSVAYRVREVTKIDDGTLCRILLSKMPPAPDPEE